jgi:hypothetical protein
LKALRDAIESLEPEDVGELLLHTSCMKESELSVLQASYSPVSLAATVRASMKKAEGGSSPCCLCCLKCRSC